MDGIKNLYDYLKKNNAIDQKETFESFSNAMKVPERRQALYNGMYDRQLTKMRQVDFDERFFGIQPGPPKKKDVQAPFAPQSEEQDTSWLGPQPLQQKSSGVSQKEIAGSKTEPIAQVKQEEAAPITASQEKQRAKLITPVFKKASFFAETPPLVFAPEVREEMQEGQRQITEPTALPGQEPQPRLQARPQAAPGGGIQVMKPGETAVPQGMSFAPTGVEPIMEIAGGEDIDEWAKKTNIYENKSYADKTFYKEPKTKGEKLSNEQMQADNALLYSKKSSEQVNEASKALEQRYGKDFAKKAYAIESSIAELGGVPGEVMDANGLTAQDVEFYKRRVFADSDYKRWRSGIQGYAKGYSRYQELINSGELKERELLKQELQIQKDRTLTSEVGYGEALNRYYADTAVRALGSFVSAALTIPRTATELAELATGAELDEKGALKKTVNKLGAAGDYVKEFIDIYVPDFSFSNKDIFTGTSSEQTAKLLHKITQAGADMYALGVLSRGSRAGVWGVSALRGQKEAWDEAESLGIYDPGEKALYATTKGISIGFLEAYLGSIETKLGGGVTGKLSKDAVRNLISGKGLTIGGAVKEVLKDTGLEIPEEILTQVADDIMKSAFNRKAEAPEIAGLDEYKEIIAVTAVLTPLMGGPASVASASMANAYNIDRISKMPEKFESIINQIAAEGELTREQADEYIRRGNTLGSYSNGLGNTVNETERGQLLSLEWARMELESVTNNQAIMPAVRLKAKEDLKRVEEMQREILSKTPEQRAQEAEAAEEAVEAEPIVEPAQEVTAETETAAIPALPTEVVQEIEATATREVEEAAPQVSASVDAAIEAFTDRFSDADGNIDIEAIEADMRQKAEGREATSELNNLVQTVQEQLGVDSPKALEILNDYVAEVRASMEPAPEVRREAEGRPAPKLDWRSEYEQAQDQETKTNVLERAAALEQTTESDLRTIYEENKKTDSSGSRLDVAIGLNPNTPQDLFDNIIESLRERDYNETADKLIRDREQKLQQQKEDGKQVTETTVQPEAQDIGAPQAEGAIGREAEGAGAQVQAAAGEAGAAAPRATQEGEARPVTGRPRTPAMESLAEAPIPEMTTPALAAALYDQGLISREDYMEATQDPYGTDIPDEVRERIREAKPRLRELDDIDLAIERATTDNVDRILGATTNQEMQRVLNSPVIAETETEIAINVPQSLRGALANLGGIRRGDFFVFPKESKEAALAAAFGRVTPDPNLPPPAPPTSPAFLFFNSPFGYGRLKGMVDSINKATGVSDKIKAAKRYIGGQRKIDPVALSKRLGEKFGVDVSFDKADMQRILSEAGKDPATLDRVKGFVYDGKVYINPDFADAETPIHEFGHLWSRALKQNSPEAFEQIRRAIEGTTYMESVRNNPDYASLDEDAMIEEAVAQAIGTRGAAIVEPTAWARVKDAFQGLYTYIAETLGFDGPYVADIKFSQMADAMALDLLSDTSPSGAGSSLIDQTTKSIIGKNKSLRAAVISNLNIAVSMEMDGNSDQDIFNKTGWYRGADGVWKYDGTEMTDAMSIPSSAALVESDTEYSITDFFHNENLIQSTTLAGASVLVSPSAKEVSVETRDGNQVIVIPSKTLKGNQAAVKAEVAVHIQRAMRPENNRIMDEAAALSSITAKRNQFPKESPRDTFDNMVGETAANLKTAISRVTTEQTDTNMADFSALSEMGVDMPGLKPASNDIAFLFGKRRVADAATVIAARQIIDAAIQNNNAPFTGINDPNVSSLLRDLRDMGLSDVQIRKQLMEAAAASGKFRITASDIKLASNKERLKALGEKFVNEFLFYFRIGGVQPKSMKDLNLQRKAKLATMATDMLNSVRKMDLLIARMAQTSAVQRAAASKTGVGGGVLQAAASLERGVRRLSEDAQTNEQIFRDLAMSALENEEAAQFLDTTPITVEGVGTYSLFDIVAEIRQKQNELSRTAVVEGVFGKNLVMAILKNAGLGVESLKISSGQPTGIFTDEEASMFARALAKRPFMRTAEEQNLIQMFLDNAPQGWGSYVYRSYKKFEDPSWLEKVKAMPEVWDRAKTALTNMVRDDLAYELDLLRIKQNGIGAQEQQLRDRVVDEINALQNQIDTAEVALEEIQQRISTQQAAVAQGILPSVNANYAAWEQARRARLDKLKDTMTTLQDFANLSTTDLLDFADIPHSEAAALTNPMRRIYSEVVKLKDLNMKLIEAQGASFERMNNLKAMLDPAVIEAKMEEIARAEESGGFGTTSRLGAISQELTKRRKDIPVEVRDLMGEIRDPRQAVLRSTFRLAQAIANAKFQNEMLSIGLQEGWIKEALPGGVAPKGYVLIAPKGSPSMGPLAGYYATENVFRELNYADTTPRGNSLGENLSKFYLRATGFVKIAKTVYSPDTQLRNLYSNVMMAGANGWLFDRDIVEALKASGKAYKFALSEQELALANELRAAGVLGNSISRGELEEAASWFSGEKPSEDNVYAFSEFAPKSVIAKGTEAAKHYYQATDEALKYFAFIAEANKYGRSMYGKKFSDLTGIEREKVKEIAAKNVRALTPDYSLQSRISGAFRKFPLGPTFVSFPIEMIRTQVNWFEIAYNDLKNPDTRSIGVKRVASSLAWNAALVGMYQAAKALIGVDDEEEKAIEPGLAPWERNQPRLFISKDKLSGELTYFNFGNIDPYANWKSSIYAYMNSPKANRMERIGESAAAFMSPFIATEITAAYSIAVIKGVNVDDGKELYVKDRSFFEQDNMKAFINATAKNFSPGALNTAVDLVQVYRGNTVDQYGNVKDMKSAIYKAFGLRANTVNPKSDNFIYFWGRRANDDISAQKKNFKKKLNTFISNLEKRIDNPDTPVETVIEYWKEEYPKLKENELHDQKYYAKSINKWKELTGRLLNSVTYDRTRFDKSFNSSGMSKAEREAVIKNGGIPQFSYGERWKKNYEKEDLLKAQIEVRRQLITQQRLKEAELEAQKPKKK